MPNPLFNKQRVTSTAPQTKDTEAKEPDKPRLESFAGDNFPYRGSENHGVKPNAQPDEFDGYDGTIPAEYEEREPAPEPIAVRVVTEGKRELRDWLVRREYAGSQSNRILPLNPHRTKVRIRNLGAVNVWVAPTSNVAVFIGYPIPAGTEFLLDAAESEVWAVSEDGNQQALAIMVEYVRVES